MCHPAVAYAAMAIAGAISAKASYDQGKFSKGVSEYNARVDQNAAQEVRNKGRIAESEERQRAMEFQSRQRAVLAARGVNIDSGTALQVQEDTGLVGEVNAMRIRQNTEQQASALREQAVLTRAEGKNAKRQGTAKAVSSIIGSIGAAAGSAATAGGSASGGNSTLWDSGTLGTGGKGAVADKWYMNTGKFNLGTKSLKGF